MTDINKKIKCTVDTVGYSQKPTGQATAIIQKRFKENPALHLQEMTSAELLYKVGENGYSDFIGIYKSFSYTDERQKHRIIFELPVVITDRRMVSLLYLLFMQVLPSDKQCIDPARLYFGGKGVIEGTNMPLSFVNLYTAIISELDKVEKQSFTGYRCKGRA